MMIIVNCNQQISTCYANRYLSARTDIVTHVVFLLLLMNICVISANAQRHKEQIVFVSEGEDRDEIHLSKPGGGQIQKLTLQPKRYATPSLSYDGKRVAFASADGGSRDYDIFVMDIQSREKRQVTFAGSRDLYPSWSPDGSRIVFASDAGGIFNLYTVDENGENRTRITYSTGDDVHPDWSPDGRKLAFVSDQASAVHQVYLMDPRTGEQQKMTQRRYSNRYPRWSPDGTKLAFYSSVSYRGARVFRQIWQVTADGTGLKSLITDGEFNDEPVLSPDLKHIAFISTRDDNTDIYTFDKDSREILRLTHDPSFDSQPGWSPDGKHLVFVSRRSGNADIYKINAKGGEIVNLTRSKADENSPVWSPRGAEISFVRTGGGKGEIHVMDSDGNRQMRLDNTPFSNTKPSWSPQGDKVAFLNKPEKDTKVYRIYTIGSDGQNKQLLFETEATDIRRISWSADGKSMLFVYFDGEIQEIRILDVITREVDTIDTNTRAFGVDNAAWAPLGRTIVFSAFPVRPLSILRTVRYGIFLIDADGDKSQEPEPIRDSFNSQPLRYENGGFTWSPDGQNILFGRRNSGNLYVTGLTGGGVTRHFINAHSPDWKTPVYWKKITPDNKLQTTWGDVKK